MAFNHLFPPPFEIKQRLDDLLSDEEEGVYVQAVSALVKQAVNDSPSHCGRAPGSKNVRRGLCRWFEDYLDLNPVYPPNQFRQIFYIPLSMYRVLHKDLVEEEPGLGPNINGTGHCGHTSHQKIICSLQKLATGLSHAQLDDMPRMCPESQREAFKMTLRAI